MVSIWWVMWVFVLGGFAGVMTLALMRVAASEGEHAARAEEALRRGNQSPARLDLN